MLKPKRQQFIILKKRVAQTYNATVFKTESPSKARICHLKQRELLKSLRQQFVIQTKKDSLIPIECEDLEAGNIKDTDEDGLFLRKNI